MQSRWIPWGHLLKQVCSASFLLHRHHSSKRRLTFGCKQNFLTHYLYLSSGQRKCQSRHLEAAAHWFLHTSAQPAWCHSESRVSLHVGEDPAQGHLLRGTGECTRSPVTPPGDSCSLSRHLNICVLIEMHHYRPQVASIRQHLATIYEKEGDWRNAAQVLVGIPLETGQK